MAKYQRKQPKWTDLSTWTPIPGLITSIVAGDFDGDGDEDIAGIKTSTRKEEMLDRCYRLSSLPTSNFYKSQYFNWPDSNNSSKA